MKHKTKGMLMILLMLHSCIIPMSCMTTETVYKGIDLDETLPAADKIDAIILKSGDEIYADQAQISLIRLSDESDYAFVIKPAKITWSGDKIRSKGSAMSDTVRFKDVSKVIVTETNVSMTILATLGITLGVLLIAALIVAASFESHYGH